MIQSINTTLNLSTPVFISNECFNWCKSNIPVSCSLVPPYIYLAIFMLVLGMGLQMLNNKPLGIIGVLLIIFSIPVFISGWL